MRRFGLVGAALVLLAGSASAQEVLKVTTTREGHTKTTVIERVPAASLLPPCPPPCPPKAPLCCLLPDQPALLYRLSVMNALHMSGYGVGGMGTRPRLDDLPRPGERPGVPRLDDLPRPGGPAGPKLDDLPQPTRLDDKKPSDEEKKPIEEKKVEKEGVRELPLPATMITLDATDWYCGRCFTDDCGRKWCLLKGCVLPEKVSHMRGWLLESDAKKMYFVHETGNIYARVLTSPVGP